MPEWMTSNLLPLGICLIAYLMGSASSAIVVCKLMRLEDPRGLGSGNPGASNVLRNHGKRPAAFTFAGDTLKVIIPIVIGIGLGISPYWLSWVACAGCLGHMYSLFHKFEGGKGVATAFGAIFTLFWPLGCLLGIIWLALAKLTGTASVGSIAAWLCAPFVIYFWQPDYWPGIACMSAFIVYRHKDNIKRLLAGEENALKSEPPPS